MQVGISQRFGRLALAGLMALGVQQAHAGLIVVAGDENIADALVGNGTAVNAGNQRFFANVLGSGVRVDVQGSDTGGVDTPVANINTFYNTLAGVTSTIQSGPVTAASLAGVNLFVTAIPATAFTASEISTLANFSAAGGTLFLLGDASGFAPTQDANLNALLIGIGSALRIVPDSLDAGFHAATAGQIVTDPLTAGVSSFSYAFVSQVSGGNALFRTTGGQTFLAATGEFATAAVPEPSTSALFGIAMVGLFGLGRRARRQG